jgi:hypothetical protein
MLIKKGDEFTIACCSQIQEIKNFLKENRKNIRLEELYSLYVYMLMIPNSIEISMPLHILKCEHPDFVLGKQIGIEVVMSATEEEKHAWGIMKKEYPEGSMLETPYYAPGSKVDIREGIRRPDEPLQSSGYGDYGCETAWLDCVRRRLHEKTCLFNKAHFLRYKSNHLIIYDDTPYFPEVDYVIRRLRENYKEYNPSFGYYFDRVHIIMNVKKLFVADVFGKGNLCNIPSEFEE